MRIKRGVLTRTISANERGDNKAQCANEGYTATKRGANEARIHEVRAIGHYAATERNANKLRNQNMHAKLRADKVTGDPSSRDPF